MRTKQNIMGMLLIAILAFALGACSSATDGGKETNSSIGTEQNTTTSTYDTETNTNEANTTASNETNGTVTNDSGTTEQNTTTSTNDDTGESTDETNSTTQTEVSALQSLKLTVAKTSLNKDENTTLKAEATYADNSTKDVTYKVQWVATPSDAVKVSNTTLTALQDTPTTLSATIDGIRSNEVRLDITWRVNGHTLPPEPDKALNDSTLLGIDVNDNGVRDDVERYIIIKEAKNPNFPKTWTVITLQFAWAWQKMIGAPTIESRRFLEDVSACREYFIDKYTKYMNYQDYRSWRKVHSSLLGVDLEDKIFNTKERIQQRFKFNKACRGNIFDLRKAEISACHVNIDEIVE